MELYWGARERRVGYWWSVMSLVGHLIRTANKGFRGSLNLWKGILLALLSVVSVIKAFINAPRLSDFDATRRLP
jgi:hypothetical protein